MWWVAWLGCRRGGGRHSETKLSEGLESVNRRLLPLGAGEEDNAESVAPLVLLDSMGHGTLKSYPVMVGIDVGADQSSASGSGLEWPKELIGVLAYARWRPEPQFAALGVGAEGDGEGVIYVVTVRVQ